MTAPSLGLGCRGKEPEWRSARARVAISLGGCAQRRWQAGCHAQACLALGSSVGNLRECRTGAALGGGQLSGTQWDLQKHPTAHTSTPLPRDSKTHAWTSGRQWALGGSGHLAAGVGVRHEAGMWQARGAGVPSVGPLFVCLCSSDQEEGQQESGGGGGTPRWPPAHPHTQVSSLSLCPVVPRHAGDGCHGNPPPPAGPALH